MAAVCFVKTAIFFFLGHTSQKRGIHYDKVLKCLFHWPSTFRKVIIKSPIFWNSFWQYLLYRYLLYNSYIDLFFFFCLWKTTLSSNRRKHVVLVTLHNCLSSTHHGIVRPATSTSHPISRTGKNVKKKYTYISSIFLCYIKLAVRISFTSLSMFYGRVSLAYSTKLELQGHTHSTGRARSNSRTHTHTHTLDWWELSLPHTSVWWQCASAWAIIIITVTTTEVAIRQSKPNRNALNIN